MSVVVARVSVLNESYCECLRHVHRPPLLLFAPVRYFEEFVVLHLVDSSCRLQGFVLSDRTV